MRKRIGWLSLTWLGIIILPIPLLLILNQQMVDTPDHLFAYDCGVIAYVWWLVAIWLSTRPRWLTQLLGMPTVYLLHGLLGVFAIGLATIHKFLSFSMFPLIKDTGNIAWYLEIFLIIYAILFLSGWLVDRVALLRHVKGLLERHLFKHQVSLWIHRLNWVVVALIWLHVQLISRLDIPAFRLVFNLYTLMTILVYLWWKIRQRHCFQRGVVVTNEAIDNHLQSLTVQLTTNRHPYHAGDFYGSTVGGLY